MADSEFYRAVCLERIKDLFVEVRHLDSQALTAFSLTLLLAAGLASVIAFFVTHHSQTFSYAGTMRWAFSFIPLGCSFFLALFMRTLRRCFAIYFIAIGL